MAVGIPDYRLPRDILRRPRFRPSKTWGRNQNRVGLWSGFYSGYLKAEGFKAFYLALGLHKSRGLGIAGEDLPNVFKGVDFLASGPEENR